ncbi:hypothetical protein RYH70_08275 [Alloalcanivorax xenomutans]|nr:hypothetical protein [Alloalcanivorax xenomutans]WOD30577.1 hypothetical protein RYH70_08275 [Alloalcanivorax xenomutans]
MAAMEFIAAHWASYLSCCSSSIRIARSRNSGGYLIGLLIAPSSQGLEPPTKPGRFTSAAIIHPGKEQEDFFSGYSMPRILKAYSREQFTFVSQFVRLSMPMGEAGRVGGQVTGQVAKLIAVLQVPMSRKEMMNTLGLRGRDNFEKLYLRPALSEGYIEYTLPDKPNSRLQQYRLTEKGRAALASSKPN